MNSKTEKIWSLLSLGTKIQSDGFTRWRIDISPDFVGMAEKFIRIIDIESEIYFIKPESRIC
jgi:hypothetical protein